MRDICAVNKGRIGYEGQVGGVSLGGVVEGEVGDRVGLGLGIGQDAPALGFECVGFG